MASFVFNSLLADEANGQVVLGSDTFYVMLLTDAATPNKDTWTKRSDVTNEVTGDGYTAGGAAVAVSVGAVDTVNDRVEVSLGGASWPTSTITARYAVYYKRRGGAASADELVAVNDFGSNVSSVGAALTLNASTYQKNNP